MFEKFARASRTAVEDAVQEAQQRGDRRIASEHLLVALLQNHDLAKIVGVNAEEAHAASERLDRDALEAVGLSIGEIPPATPSEKRKSAIRMTASAKAVMQASLTNAVTERSRVIAPRHLLGALLDRPASDPVSHLIDALAIDRATLRQKL